MITLTALLALLGGANIGVEAAGAPDGAVQAGEAVQPAEPVVCLAPGPQYYAIELFTTRNVPGTGYARGHVDVSVPAQSPFVVAVTEDGSYRYQLEVTLERMRAPAAGTLVAWVTTPNLDRLERLGALDSSLRARGGVRWNQFLVVVTLEATDDPDQPMWSGPIVLRGMSRSGMLHTMVGHGALQEENCAAYGYGN